MAAAVVAAAGATWWSARTSEGHLTVAVLPLENLDRDPASDYFADGLTDEIIRNLSMIDGLTVPSRTSSFALKGKSLNPAEAGKQLGADYLVEGSVQHAGDQLRVNVALIRVRDDFRLWSERFDRKLTDVFAIQDEISQGIVNTLRLRFPTGRRRYEANLEAYDSYLRGRQIMASFPTQGRPIARPAIEYFEQAITKDPNYAIAYAGMADALVAVERNMGAASAAIGGLARARAAAERAVELDPMLSEAQSAMASVRAREYAWQEAERGFRRAIELNPNNALAHLELGFSVLVVQGRFEEGLEEVRRAVRLDPLSPYVNTEFGRALIWAGKYDEGIDQFRKAIALEPSRNRPYSLLARALSLRGKNAEALTVLDDAVKRGAQLASGPAADDSCVLARLGRRDEVLAIVQRQLNAPAAGARSVAQTYACLGDADRTLEYLEKALKANEPNLAEIVQSPDLAWMRPNPRFATLRNELNLAP